MGQSRTENILENMLGAENELDEPQSRAEELLMQLLEQGGGGSELPIASASTLGGVKIGSGLAVNSEGVLSISLTDADEEVF